MSAFWIGLIAGVVVYVISALVFGSKSSVVHYLLMFMAVTFSFIVWAVGDRVSDITRSFCSGFWIPIALFLLIRFGSAMLPGNPKQSPKRYVR